MIKKTIKLLLIIITYIALMSQNGNARPAANWRTMFGTYMDTVTIRINAGEDQENEIVGYYLDKFPCYNNKRVNQGDFRIRKGMISTLRIQCIYPPEEITFGFREINSQKKTINEKSNLHGLLTCAVWKNEDKKSMIQYETNMDACYGEKIADFLQ